MGLIDRDYMNEKRPRQAVTHAAENSAVSTLFMVLVFVVALFFLYKLADWHLNQRARGFPAQSEPSVQPTPHQAPPRREAYPLQREQGSRTYPEAPEPTAGNHVITKCIVNGKTSYGDGSCTGGAVTTQVTTRADQNIMAPVRAAATVTTQTTYSPAPAAVTQNTASSDYAAKKMECQSLDTYIQHLDSMSRQIQSGQTMDWIKDERKKARDRQFRIPCR